MGVIPEALREGWGRDTRKQEAGSVGAWTGWVIPMGSLDPALQGSPGNQCRTCRW